MALVYIRPDADTTDGNWVNESASNTNLYDSVNESVASDSDYIRSGNNPVNDIVKLRLGNFSSVPDEPMTVRYRFKKVVSAGEVLSLKVRLIEGDAPGTTIAEWEHDGVADTYTDGEQELTSGQFALISDFDDLYLEFEAISGALVVIEPGPFDGSYLLTDEDEGFAINAMYPGGSVAVIDAGTPANDLDDVPLDSSNLTQAGTSPKMVYWHEAPYVRWTAHNYLLQSQDFATTWAATGTSVVSTNTTVAPDGTTTTADTITDDDPFESERISQEIASTLPSVQYCFSCYFLKTGSASYPGLRFHGNSAGFAGAHITCNTLSGVTTLASGSSMSNIAHGAIDAGDYWRFYVTGNTTDSALKCWVYAQQNTADDDSISDTPVGSVVAWGAQLNRGYLPTPYLATTTAARIGIPQAYDIDEDMFGILVEPAATNIQLYSQQIDGGVGSWTEGNVTAVIGATAPDGTSTATTVTASAGSAAHSIYYSGGVTGTDAEWTFSCYLKKGTAQYVQLTMTSGDSLEWLSGVFDLTNGAVTEVANGASAGAATSEIVAIGDGWYRCTVTGDNNDTVKSVAISIVDSGTPTQGGFGNVTFTAAGTETVLCWGAQIELGTIASTYIPTLGSTVTRATDKVQAENTTLPIALAETAITFYADVGTFVNMTEPVMAMIVNSNRTNHIGGSSSNWRMLAEDNNAGGTQCNTTLGAQSAPERAQISARFKANDFAGSLNGAAIAADTSGAMVDFTDQGSFQFAFLDDGFGTDGGGSKPYRVFRVVVVPRAVIDSDLQAWRNNY